MLKRKYVCNTEKMKITLNIIAYETLFDLQDNVNRDVEMYLYFKNMIEVNNNVIRTGLITSSANDLLKDFLSTVAHMLGEKEARVKNITKVGEDILHIAFCINGI